jgi:hypothetical protein
MNAAARIALCANGLAWVVLRAASGAAQDFKCFFGWSVVEAP